MASWEKHGLYELLVKYPTLLLRDSEPDKLILEGEYSFNIQMDGYESLSGSTNLRLEFPRGYPKDLPKVYELGEKIPKIPDLHVNYGDNSFCLGSRLSVLREIDKDSTLVAFLENIVGNFLYRIFYKLEHGIFPGGDLPHGEKGLIEDYESSFGVMGKDRVLQVLKAISLRKRVANKMRCPCDGSHRLGNCSLRFRIAEARKITTRRMARSHLKNDFSPMPPKPKTKRKIVR